MLLYRRTTYGALGAIFSTKSYTECPQLSFSGRHMYVTFIFECPLRRPQPAPVGTQREYNM